MKEVLCVKRMLGFFLGFFLFYGDMVCLKAAPNGVAEESESSEEKRRQLLTTVEAAKQYQDMIDEQMNSLKSENKELHEKIIQLKNQFESVVNGVASNLEKNRIQQALPSAVATPVPPQAPAKMDSQAVTAPVQASSPEKTPETAVKMREEAPEPTPTIPKEPVVETTNDTTWLTTFPLKKADKWVLALGDIKFMGGFLVLGILLLVWFVWGRRSNNVDLPKLKVSGEKKSSFSNESTGGTQGLMIPVEQMIVPIIAAHQEGEYDYMGSAEAIPARLDLARMYKDMGDLAQAEQVLKSIRAQGDEAQCVEAEKILIEMGKKPS